MTVQNCVTVNKYNSHKKQVSLVEYKGQKCILKLYEDSATAHADAEMMKQVARTGYAPQIIESADNYYICEFIDGETLAVQYHNATLQDDSAEQELLANRLCIFLQMFHSISGGYIYDTIDFDNFVIKDDRCIGISFYSMREGLPYMDVANVIAYAIANSAGDMYAGFPFIFKVLTCFHLRIMDIINELASTLDSYMPSTFNKSAILDSLIDFSEKGTAWKIINK